MSCTKTVIRQVLSALTVVLALIIVSSPNAAAQRTLTLAEAMGIGLTQSITIELEQIRYDQQRFGLELVKSNLKTRMDLRFTLPEFSKGITSIETGDATVFRDDKSFRSSGSLTITQPLLFSNGTLSLRSSYSTLNLERETGITQNNPTGIIETNRWTDDFRLTYNQPLFRPNTLRNELESTERSFTIAEKRFEETENTIWFQVQQQFYSLYRSKRRLEIQEQNYQNINQNYQVSVNKFQAGILAAVDKMQWQVDLANAELDLISQELQYTRQKDQFKRYIGMDMDEDFEPVANIEVTPIDFDKSKALEEAMVNSVNLLNSEYGILDQKNNLEETKAQDRIQIDLTLSYGLNEQDDFGRLLNGSWNWNWTNGLLKDFSQTNSATINLNIPIFDSGRRKNRIAGSEIGILQTVRSLDNSRLDLQQQIQTIFDEIDNARKRINTSSGSVTVAEEQYSISQQRFEIGDITSDQLFTSNTRLTNAKEGALNAQIDYLLATADLYRQTFWDFENNRPLNETVQTLKR